MTARTEYVIFNTKRRQFRSDASRNHIVEAWHKQTEFWATHPSDATPYESFDAAKSQCGPDEHVERIASREMEE